MSRTGRSYEISVVQPGGTNPTWDVLVTEAMLVFTMGFETVMTLRCVLDRESDGSFEGPCVNPDKLDAEPGRLLMVPPRSPAR